MFLIENIVFLFLIYKIVGLGWFLAGMAYLLVVLLIFITPREDYSACVEVIDEPDIDKYQEAIL